MNDDTKNREDAVNQVSKLLKNLPTVKTSADFEARLQRRITEEKSTEQIGFLGKIFQPKFVPVFSYSIVAMIAVGVVSYYVFLRTGVQSPLSLPANESPGSIQEKVVTSPPAESADARLRENEGFTKEENRPIGNDQNRRDERISPEGKSAMNQADKKADAVDEKDADDLNAVQSLQSESGAAAAVQDQTQPKTATKVQERSLAQPSAIGTQQMIQSTQIQNAEPMYRKSTSLLDSVRQDSLQKAQKQLLLLQQKTKSKKPF